MPGSLIGFIGSHYEAWPNTPINVTTAFTDVYTKTASDIILIAAVFQLNTDKADIRVVSDSVTRLDMDLDELQKNYRLKSTTGSSGGGTPRFGVVRYSDRRWKLTPIIPFRANDALKIQIRAHSGTKKVERGFSVLGVRP